MKPVDEATGTDRAPALWRRLVCFLYEGVLLLGVVMIGGLFYALVTRQTHALHGQTGLRVWLFLLLGAYFVWFWTRGGQTLAMQTWHIRLETATGQTVGWGRACLRYLLAWLWFVPALAMVSWSGLKSTALVFTAMAVGVLVYGALSRLHPQRQFWHDVVAGTRLVHWERPKRP
jgi:uncharacterized RDD family membrane protein YckC